MTIVLPASSSDKHLFCDLGLTTQSGNGTVSDSQATAISAAWKLLAYSIGYGHFHHHKEGKQCIVEGVQKKIDCCPLQQERENISKSKDNGLRLAF